MFKGLPVDLVGDLCVFSFLFVFVSGLVFMQAPFRHLKHGLLQRFLESVHRLPQVHTQKSSAGWATGGVPSILDIVCVGSNWEFPRHSRDMLFVCGVDTSAGAGAAEVVLKGLNDDVQGFFVFNEPRRAASSNDETSMFSKVKEPHPSMYRSMVASTLNGCVTSLV